MSFLLRPIDTASSHTESSVLKVLPKPCFVIKSRVTDGGKTSVNRNTKIFINVCHDDQIPSPDIDFNPGIVYPLIINNQWEIPIVTSSLRDDMDKKGNACCVCDCCINTKAVSWIQDDLQLREIVVEWCLESCELRADILISRDDISFPKLKKKGDEIPALEILNEDLKEDYKETIDSMLSHERKDPMSIIEMKRDLVESDDLPSNELPPLIPTGNPTERKPLIQEIEDLSIREPKKPKIDLCLKALSYDVSMGKTKDSSEFLLKVEVTSELESSLDYDVRYDPSTNTIVIKNNNVKVFPEKKLELPLPDVFTGSPKLKCFFVKPERKLVMFL